MVADWEKYAEIYIKNKPVNSPVHKDRLRILRNFSVNKSVIDIGCGAFEPLLIANNQGVVATDVSHKALLHLKRAGFKGELVLCDGRQLPFKDSSFQMAICSEVIEHINAEDAKRLVKESNRVSFLVVLTTPNCSYGLKITDSTHIMFYTVRTLREMLGSNWEVYVNNKMFPDPLLQFTNGVFGIPYNSPTLRKTRFGQLIHYLFYFVDTVIAYRVFKRLIRGTYLFAVNKTHNQS